MSPVCESCGKAHRPASPKQARFAELYLVKLDATWAAKEAGYSKKNASQMGYKLVQNSSVSCLIQAGAQARSERTRIEQDWVLTRLARIADVDPREFFDDDGALKPLSEIPEDVRKTLASLETEGIFLGSGADREKVGQTQKLKFPDRLKALEMIGRHLGMFVDRLEVDHGIDLREEILRGRERAKAATG